MELALQSANLPFTFIRPQYIYGPKSSKRYLDFFIGRAARKLPIPLPLSGQQLVSLSHIEDVCSLIGAAVGHPAATNQVRKKEKEVFRHYRIVSFFFFSRPIVRFPLLCFFSFF